MKGVFITSILIICVSSQQLIDLNSLTGGNQKNAIYAHAPYDVFVSAASDDSDVLMQIHLITNDKQNISFYDLTNRKPFLTTSQITPFPVQTSAYVTTNLTASQIASLTGMMFISSTIQLQVNNFHVIDVTRAQNLYLPDENQTILFLNSNTARSTTISNFNQSTNSSIYIYKGIPTDSYEKLDSHIFSNPLLVQHYTRHPVFIPNVEKFSLKLKAFYVKYYGKVAFEVAPESYDPNKSSTTAFLTTGFYMKPVGQKDTTTSITTLESSGSIGANIVGTLPENSTVTVGIDQSTHQDFIPRDQIENWTVDRIGKSFDIYSTNGTDGEYFVQYYIIPSNNSARSSIFVLLIISMFL